MLWQHSLETDPVVYQRRKKTQFVLKSKVLFHERHTSVQATTAATLLSMKITSLMVASKSSWPHRMSNLSSSSEFCFCEFYGEPVIKDKFVYGEHFMKILWSFLPRSACVKIPVYKQTTDCNCDTKSSNIKHFTRGRGKSHEFFFYINRTVCNVWDYKK